MGKVASLEKARRNRSSNVVEVQMKKVKETKGAYQYSEIDDDGDIIEDYRDVKIGSIYLRKDALDGEKGPKEITVNVSW